MKKIKILKNWSGSVLGQSPGAEGIWKDNLFNDLDIINDLDPYDVVNVLNDVGKKKKITVGDKNVFLFIMEPPTNTPDWIRSKPKIYKKITTSDENMSGPRIVHNHWPIIWRVDKTYDELISISIPNKTKNISWVTSNKKYLKGHKKRMDFLKKIQSSGLRFDLFGKGFDEVGDKWESIAPYKYSLAVENFSGKYYWSEKIADCFLSWTMPIYYGCTDIEKFFPKKSYIQINIDNAPESINIIENTIKNNEWEKNIKAIEEARDLVLNKYQLFPYLSIFADKLDNVKKYKEEKIKLGRELNIFDKI